MTMLFTQNLHADGWWDHMPPGHRVDIVMNPGKLPSSSDETASGPTSRASIRPTTAFVAEPIVNSGPAGRTSPRRIKRSHASAWILLAAVGATGGALAVAAMHDPQGMRQQLDATLAEVKNMTGTSSSTDTTITAQAEATAITPEPTLVQEPAPAAEAKAIVPGRTRSSDLPLMPVAPAAGQGASDTSTVPRVKQLAPPATDMTKELPETQQVVPNPLPLASLPHLPPPPAVEAPPAVQAPPTVVAPPAVQPSDEVAPPPVQAPASSPQP